MRQAKVLVSDEGGVEPNRKTRPRGLAIQATEPPPDTEEEARLIRRSTKLRNEPNCFGMQQRLSDVLHMISRLAYPCAVTLLCLAICGPTHAESCRSESFKGASYIVCSFNPTKDDLRIYWRDDDGKPYRTFASLAGGLKAQGKSLKFAMNGGMYQDDLRPVGLHIENGRELTRANTATRSGAPSQIPNFYKKPERRVLYRRWRSGHPGVGQVSRR